MERTVTRSAEVKLVLVVSLPAPFASLTVDALPIRLKHTLDLVARELQTVGVEAFCAETTRHEFVLIAKRAAEVAHFFEDECGVVEGAADRVGVVAALVVLVLVLLDHLLPGLFSEPLARDSDRSSRLNFGLDLEGSLGDRVVFFLNS